MAKILIIDDDALIRMQTKKLLKDNGFEVNVAENGKIGLQMAHKLLPDLIICDVNMPILNGYDVLKKLKNSTRTKSIPFIFYSSDVSYENLRKGMLLGADDYLLKPIQTNEILFSITNQLEKSNVKKEQTQIKQIKTFRKISRNFRIALTARFI
ncbi:MAG: response regulator [Calditrichaeota bacterium]|nr:MAG: response regulator [Calditrichota bacterium]